MNFFKSLDAVAKQLPTILVGPTCAPVDVMDFHVYLLVLTVMAASVRNLKRLPKKMTVVQMSNLVIQFTWMKKTCYLAQKRLFQSRLFATAAIVISWIYQWTRLTTIFCHGYMKILLLQTLLLLHQLQIMMSRTIFLYIYGLSCMVKVR